MIKVYRKTGTIKAEQFDGSDKQIKKYGIRPPYPQEIGTITDEEWRPLLPTKEDLMTCHIGDWIVTGVHGEHWPIADDVFKKTYTELPVIPENVAYVIKQAKKNDYKLGWVFYATYTGLWRDSICNWIRTNAETFVRAWLDGYVVEEDND